ncbi:MAG: hypothetical protein CBE17_01860 [Gammaproteobacteria bacterium TMED257]|nr:MAG: hypothetical protein CBE17_01860 [Gammaproteobacteria bacterium TMED257]|tara:strand:- start:3347 stop:4969 length:1623 start_codon:yes stop_codon:yes gene_type:complete
MIDKLKVFLDDLVKVSKITKAKNKKIKIVSLAFISNSLVFFDILIILYFSSMFSQEIQFNNIITDYFLEKEYLLPLVIFLRFFFIYLEKIITINLQISVEKNLRLHLLEEVFVRGNVSVSDAYFYVNTLSAQVGGFYSTLSVFFGSLIQIIVFSGYLLLSNLNIVLIFGGGILILFIPTFLLTKLGRKYAHIAYVSMNQISKDIEKVLDNLFLIKILKLVKKELESFENSLRTFYQSRVNEVKVGTINALMPNFFTLFLLSILIVFFDFMRFLTFDFIGILLRLFQSLGIFNKNIHTVSSYHVYLERLYEIESNKDNINFDNFKLKKVKDSSVAVEIKNLSFRYLGMSEDMFHNLNLKIPKNEHTIITGPNGSGKSTLLGLMTGIFYPTDGEVVARVNKFGYVSATPMILNASLRDNLLYGSDIEISNPELVNLVSKFKLFNEVNAKTLDKQISNKSLSTGQMQKVSFIRALASGIDLLVLDESTSNLDNETKEIIFSVIKSQAITVINSTHNPEDFKSIDNQIIIHLNDDQRTIEFIKL